VITQVFKLEKAFPRHVRYRQDTQHPHISQDFFAWKFETVAHTSLACDRSGISEWAPDEDEASAWRDSLQNIRAATHAGV